MRLALDAMGGDNAPSVTVSGAILAAAQTNHEIILVGQESVIKAELAKHKKIPSNISIVNADEVITMDDHPAQAIRQKKNSSMVVAAQLVAENKADVFFTAGNSGAAMAAAMIYVGRIEGVSRPAITAILPTTVGQTVLIDVGANSDCKPKHLLEFALMGKIYIEKLFGINNPTIGLLSIGEEATKGNELTVETYNILKNSGMNFIGNIEGRDIPAGKADVVVCDGFVGNVVLKFAEGIAKMMLKLMKEGLKAHPLAWISLPFIWPALKDLRKRVDYSEHGGAPLLGVNGACLIGHGRSNEKAIKNALINAGHYAELNIHKLIAQEIKKLSSDTNNE